MFRKIKILSILFIIIVTGGCASLRKRAASGKALIPTEMDYNLIVDDVNGWNITGKGFIIRKGRIELEGTGIDGSYSFNAKLNNSGDFMASVKGPLGIELIRLIIVGDDMCLIDRIEKASYVGKKSSLLLRNEMPNDLLKVLFGDITVRNPWKNDTLTGRELIINEEKENYTRETGICIDEMKVCSVRYRFNKDNADIQVFGRK
jgi:uncharacterized protein YceK